MPRSPEKYKLSLEAAREVLRQEAGRREEGGGSVLLGPRKNRLPVPGTGHSTYTLPNRREKEAEKEGGGHRI